MEEPAVIAPPLGLIELFGSTANFETALAARRIELIELKPGPNRWLPAAEVTESRLVLDDHTAAVLRALLTFDTTYRWDPDDEVEPVSRHGMAVKFLHAGRSVRVDLFFGSRAVQVVVDNRIIAASRFEFGHPMIAAVIESLRPGTTQ